MSKPQVNRPAIAIVGGDGRDHTIRVTAEVRSYPSSRDGGNGTIRRAIAAIKRGKIQLVVLLVRWLGHPEYQSVVKACKVAGVRCLTVPRGSVSTHQQEVEDYLSGCGDPSGT